MYIISIRSYEVDQREVLFITRGRDKWFDLCKVKSI